MGHVVSLMICPKFDCVLHVKRHGNHYGVCAHGKPHAKNFQCKTVHGDCEPCIVYRKKDSIGESE